jgi:hypothetical protein
MANLIDRLAARALGELPTMELQPLPRFAPMPELGTKGSGRADSEPVIPGMTDRPAPTYTPLQAAGAGRRG